MYFLIIFFLAFTQNTTWVPHSKDPDKPKIEIIMPTKPIRLKVGEERCLVIRLNKAPTDKDIKWKFIPNNFEVRAVKSETRVITVYVKGEHKGDFGLYIDARYTIKGNNYCVFDTIMIDFIQ